MAAELGRRDTPAQVKLAGWSAPVTRLLPLGGAVDPPPTAEVAAC